MSARLHVLIFANGVFDDQVFFQDQLKDVDMVIAADGGAKHCARLHITPDILIGDFDSLDAAELKTFEMAGVKIIRHSDRKDYSDLELALLHAKSSGASQVQILGALGARWDQTLANLLLPASAQLRDLDIRILEHGQEIMLFHGGKHYEIHGASGDVVSLIPIDRNVQGVTTTGLEYPLKDDPLHFGATRGISNVMTDDSFTVNINEGLLLCVVMRHPAASAKELKENT